ncbi:LysR family transcriptional regulator [Vibrio inusitatus NBRC 102082]|uniref:LysR family transcriptional regulator n=1 Tax=Vibrio inusitatus NBRC 102082 TaxID=1219070 RepID=A0A4Y3I140_9VIBR|nr:LysR family transcriptional regulator [Vibrio inusitatus]GEA52981.1 LysR family transcriptional regulator [Vibrio inusitatus NBRC 102082]
MNFSLEQLLAFVNVYEQLSFSKAAVKLNKHRTTIGQVITNLEDQLAVTLFNRIGRSVEPTEDGHLLYHYAKQAIEQARTFDKVALSLAYGQLESINIAYSNILPQKVLADIRVQLAKDFPNMRVNFESKTKSEVKEGFTSGELHFALVNIHESSAIHSLDSTFLGNLEFMPFVKKDSEIAKLPSDKMRTALRNQRQFILKALIHDGMKDKILLSANHEEIDQLSLIVQLVQEGMGWALLPKSLMSSDYVNADMQYIAMDEMKQGFKFGFSLWSPHSKQIAIVKKSILVAINSFIDEHIK